MRNKIILLTLGLLASSLVGCKDKQVTVEITPDSNLESTVTNQQIFDAVSTKNYSNLEFETEPYSHELSVPENTVSAPMDDEIYEYGLGTFLDEEFRVGIYNHIYNQVIFEPEFNSEDIEISVLYDTEEYTLSPLFFLDTSTKDYLFDAYGNLVFEDEELDYYEFFVDTSEDGFFLAYPGKIEAEFYYDENLKLHKGMGLQDYLGEILKNRFEALSLDDYGLPGYELRFALENLLQVVKDDKVVSQIQLLGDHNSKHFITKNGIYEQVIKPMDAFLQDGLHYDVFIEDTTLAVQTFRYDFLTGKREIVPLDFIIQEAYEVKNDDGIYESVIFRGSLIKDKTIVYADVPYLFDGNLNLVKELPIFSTRVYQTGDYLVDLTNEIVFNKDFDIAFSKSNIDIRSVRQDSEILIVKDDSITHSYSKGAMKPNGEWILEPIYYDVEYNDGANYIFGINHYNITCKALDGSEEFVVPYDEILGYVNDDFIVFKGNKILQITNDGDIIDYDYDEYNSSIALFNDAGYTIANFKELNMFYSGGLTYSGLRVKNLHFDPINERQETYSSLPWNELKAYELKEGENKVKYENYNYPNIYYKFTPTKSGYYKVESPHKLEEEAIMVDSIKSHEYMPKYPQNRDWVFIEGFTYIFDVYGLNYIDITITFVEPIGEIKPNDLDFEVRARNDNPRILYKYVPTETAYYKCETTGTIKGVRMLTAGFNALNLIDPEYGSEDNVFWLQENEVYYLDYLADSNITIKAPVKSETFLPYKADTVNQSFAFDEENLSFTSLATNTSDISELRIKMYHEYYGGKRYLNFDLQYNLSYESKIEISMNPSYPTFSKTIEGETLNQVKHFELKLENVTEQTLIIKFTKGSCIDKFLDNVTIKNIEFEYRR